MADDITIKSETDIKDLENLVLLLEKKNILDKQDIDNINQKRDSLNNLNSISNIHKDVLINLDQRINNLVVSHKSLAVAIEETEEASDSVTKSFSLFNDITSSASYYLGQLTSSFGSVEDQISKYNNLTKEQANLSALAIAGITGIESRFNNLSFDTGNLNLLRDDINSFVKGLNESNLGSGINFVDKLFGGSAPKEVKGKIQDALSAGGGVAVDVVKGIISDYANATDNVQKLSSAFLQMSAATGNLGSVQDAAGDKFVNLNKIIATQSKSLDDLTLMYGIQPENIEKYYTAIGKIPGALQETVQGYDGVNSELSVFQAALLQSVGAGRSFDDVIKDMHASIRAYGGDNQDALEFTARMTELSNKYKVELQDVQQYLLSTGQTFRFFGNEMEGSSQIFNSYFDAFQQTGLSKAASVEMIKGMTDGIQNLTIAQKAFLSAQTGGQGGLAGAFEIEKELREGGVDKVFDRVKETLRKQMGEIVSLEEASVSQDAAARLTKQIALVKEGPLGGFAQTDQQALRMLEAFDKNEKGESVVKELEDNPSLKIMEAGNEIQQRTNNLVGQILNSIRGVKNLSEVPLADLVNDILTAGKFREQESVFKLEFRENQENILRNRQNISAEETKDFNNQIIGQEPVKDVLGRRLIQNIETSKEVVNNVINSGKNVIEQAKEFNPGIPKSSENILNENLNNRQVEINNVNNEIINNSVKESEQKENTTLILNKEIKESNDFNDQIKNIVLNKEIQETVKPTYNEDIKRVVANQDNNVKIGQVVEQNNVNQNVNQNFGKIQVEVSGYCIDCGTKMNERSHIGVITPVR